MSTITIALISSLYFATSLGVFAGPPSAPTKNGSSVSASSGNSQNNDADDSNSLSTGQGVALAALGVGGIGAGVVGTKVYTSKEAKTAQELAAEKLKKTETERDSANTERDKAQKELSEVDELSKSIENAHIAKIGELTAQRDNAINELKSLKEEHDKLEGEHTEVKKQLYESENSVSHLRDQVKAFQGKDEPKSSNWGIHSFFRTTGPVRVEKAHNKE